MKINAMIPTVSRLSAMTWQASQKFEIGNFPAAERAYRDILKEFPEDSLGSSWWRNARENDDQVLPSLPPTVTTPEQ